MDPTQIQTLISALGAVLVLGGVGGGGEEELALAVAQGRMRRYRGLQPQVIYRRLGGMLQRRGFSSGVVARVLRQVLGANAKVDD